MQDMLTIAQEIAKTARLTTVNNDFAVVRKYWP